MLMTLARRVYWVAAAALIAYWILRPALAALLIQ